MPTPEDRRPYRRLSESGGDEMVTVLTEADGRKVRHTWRQVGWHGQSGAFYAIGESPYRYETGSFSPMWVIAHSDVLDNEGNPV